MNGPLVSRLKYYGFALVQTEPGRPVDPWAWEVPGLQALVKGSDWLTLCGQCQPYSQNSLQPVLATTWASLLRIRESQPNRPLIYCQTAYEAKPKQRHWSKLIFRQPFPFLVRDDPATPLVWAGEPEPPLNSMMLDYPPEHPIVTKLGQLQEKFPQHHFWLEEHGGLALQYHLFNQARPVITRWFDDTMEDLNQYLLGKMQSLTGPRLVLADQRDALNMFQSDLVRLWGQRFQFLHGVLPEYVEDAGRVILSLTDKEIRFGSFALRNWPVLHLGGDQRQQKYRHIRISGTRAPRWLSLDPILGEAAWQGRGGIWRFQRKESGWCLPVVARDLPRLESSFRETAACFRI